MRRGLGVPLIFMLTGATPADTADLYTRQIEELTVFGLRVMGAAANTDDVKEILSPQEIEKLVRAGLNVQGRLCARITEIDPPQMEVSASYKLTCITHSGGDRKSVV